MLKMNWLRWTSAGIVCLAGSAVAEELPPPAENPVDFHQDVWPIFEAKCISCHGPDKQKSGLRMDNKADFEKGGIEGPMLVAGNSAESLIIELVLGINEDFDIMPPKGEEVTPEEVGILRRWIDDGGVWPEGDAPAPAAAGDATEHPTTGSAAGMPAAWKVEATNQEGPLATWEVSSDMKGPNGEPVIALTSANHTYAGTFNLLWSDAKPFLDGSFAVTIKALSGEEDQGGGVLWRAKDKNNYYVARYNPLEGNFRFYKVIDGKRDKIAGVDAKIEGEWVTLKIEQEGNVFKGYLNDQLLLEATDDSLTEAGGAGFWTKADAATAFTATKYEPK